jgi:hypothetical protein
MERNKVRTHYIDKHGKSLDEAEKLAGYKSKSRKK